MTTYLLAGGGTAGHVNPLLAVADRLRARDSSAEIIVLGTKEGLEARLVPQRGYELVTIAKLPFPRRPNRAMLRFPSALRALVRECRGIIRTRKVDVVIGFGGYASAPVYLAARDESVPFVIHEANAKPGIANKLGARLTPFVGVVYANTPLPHAKVVGMPLRLEIEQLDRSGARLDAIREFDLDPNKPVLLVTGGSSGARSINATMVSSAATVLGAGWQVLHIAGEKSEVTEPDLDGYRLVRYCDRMDLAIAVADLAVARSGSATVSEFTAVGVPAIYIPYPVGNGEQRFNAVDVVAAGGAVVVADADFTPEWVSAVLEPLLADRATIAEMAAAAVSVGVRNGTDRMVELIDSAVSPA